MDLLNGIIEGARQLSLLELIGVVFGLASVLFARKGNILVFPTGIVSVAIYIYLCLEVKLYADMGINIYYLVMSVYGWYFWTRKDKEQHATPISENNRKEWIVTIATLVIAYLVLSQILIHLTDSNVPHIDAITTAIFIVGMQLMARKKIENWIAWIIGDFISIPLYFYKGLILTSLQFFVFFIIAIAGYISWKNLMHSSQAG
jgi:nicotinamide mononucleotide transporter